MTETIEQIKQLIAESDGVELSNWNTVTHAQRSAFAEIETRGRAWLISFITTIESQNIFFKGYDHQNRLIESRLEKQIESLQKENTQLHAELRNEKIKHYKYRCSTCGHFATRYSNSCQSCGSEGGYSGSFSICQAEQWYDKQLSLSHIQEEEK